MRIRGQVKVVNKYTWKQLAEEMDALYFKAIM